MNTEVHISSFADKLIGGILPDVIWVGMSKSLCQPAELCREEKGLSYVMSNETPKQHPKGTPYFKSYSDLGAWVLRVNIECSKFENRWKFVEKLKLIADLINKTFYWYVFLEIPSIEPPVLENFKSKSVLMYIKQALVKDAETVKKLKARSLQFLRFNRLIGKESIIEVSLEMIQENLVLFMKCMNDEWRPILIKHYKPKMDKYSIYGSLELAGRTNVPYVAAHMYMWEQKQEVKIKSHKDAMKNRWANFG